MHIYRPHSRTHSSGIIINISRKFQLKRKFSKVIAQLFVKFNYPFQMMTIKAKFNSYSFGIFFFFLHVSQQVYHCHCSSFIFPCSFSRSLPLFHFLYLSHSIILPAVYSVVHVTGVADSISYIAGTFKGKAIRSYIFDYFHTQSVHTCGYFILSYYLGILLQEFRMTIYQIIMIMIMSGMRIIDDFP